MSRSPDPVAGPVDPGERGRLAVASTVLREVVEHAADGAPGTLRHARRLAGFGAAPGAGARVFDGPDGAVDVAPELALPYPVSVRDAVEAVRVRVAGELERITGRRVRTLSVTVSGLRPGVVPAPAGRRVE